MTSFKHAYMLLATDFEVEPVIEHYLATYPDYQPRRYDVVYKLQDERREGDWCYIIVYEYHSGRNRPSLVDFIDSYCQLNNKVANIEKGGNVFPDIADGSHGNARKYRAR